MSAKLTGMVWELDLPHNHAWLLMSLCDHAEHDGSKVYPGNGTTAWKTGFSVSTVKRLLKSLRDEYDLIEVVKDGGGRTATEYRIKVNNFASYAKDEDRKRGGQSGNANAFQHDGEKTNPVHGEPGSDENEPGSDENEPGSPTRARVEPSTTEPSKEESSLTGAKAPKGQSSEEKPAKVMTSLTIDRTREVGFEASPSQIANWGKGWAAILYVAEDSRPPDAERQFAILAEIVQAAKGGPKTPRFFLAVSDAVKRLDSPARSSGPREVEEPFSAAKEKWPDLREITDHEELLRLPPGDEVIFEGEKHHVDERGQCWRGRRMVS